jgi:hypothetical protein
LPVTALLKAPYASAGADSETVVLELLKGNTAPGPRVAPALLVAVLLSAAAVYAVPRAADAVTGLDDPARLAGRALDGTFDAAVAQREIDAALAARDVDLAQSFVDLAADRHVAIDSALSQKVAAATAEAATTQHKAESFARGFITGVPDDMAGLAGTTVGDLFIFGDIRDALREGTRYATGEEADKLILGLACVGIAITAGTYATLGAAAPARVGLSLTKIARKTGSLGAEFAGSLGRMARGVVDWGQLRQAATKVSLTEPALAVRAAREAVKVERAEGLFNLARDVGRVEKAAGGRAALDGLKIAKEPSDITRIAKLAEKEGSRTRAILKIAGRGAITLAALAFDVSLWLLGALFAVFGFVSALKSTTERVTLRVLRRRRERRRQRELESFAAAPAHG